MRLLLRKTLLLLVFLHHIQDGPANRSFGLQVAKLAGIPSQVLQAAGDKLKALEASRPGEIQPTDAAVTQNRSNAAGNLRPGQAATPSPQVDLFSSPPPHPVVNDLEVLDIDDLSPRQALEKLYELKRKL